MGRKLKTISNRLKNTKALINKLAISGIGKNRRISPKKIAKKRLLIGPAKETVRLSNFGFAKLFGLTITGFPQPKPTNNKNNDP